MSRRVIRVVTSPTPLHLPRKWQLKFADVTVTARFGCRFDLLLGILKAPYREDTLVNRRNSALRPCFGAVRLAGVGQTDGRVFMPSGEATIPPGHRGQTDRHRFSPAGCLPAGSSHACAPVAPHSREANQRPGEHNSGAPMLWSDAICRTGRIPRTADHGWAQPVPRTTLAALPLSHTFMH